MIYKDKTATFRVAVFFDEINADGVKGIYLFDNLPVHQYNKYVGRLHIGQTCLKVGTQS